jgi:hypothetical protein
MSNIKRIDLLGFLAVRSKAIMNDSDLAFMFGMSKGRISQIVKELGLPKRPFKAPHKIKPATISPGIIYVIAADAPTGRIYKIGRTTNLKSRLNDLQTTCPYPLSVVVQYQSECCGNEEKGLHIYFADKRLRGEWFALNLDDIAFIQSFSRLNGE